MELLLYIAPHVIAAAVLVYTGAYSLRNRAAPMACNMKMEQVGREHIVSVLDLTGWRIRGKNGSAEVLDINPTTLESRMAKLGIKRPQR